MCSAHGSNDRFDCPLRSTPSIPKMEEFELDPATRAENGKVQLMSQNHTMKGLLVGGLRAEENRLTSMEIDVYISLGRSKTRTVWKGEIGGLEHHSQRCCALFWPHLSVDHRAPHRPKVRVIWPRLIRSNRTERPANRLDRLRPGLWSFVTNWIVPNPGPDDGSETLRCK